MNAHTDAKLSYQASLGKDGIKFTTLATSEIIGYESAPDAPRYIGVEVSLSTSGAVKVGVKSFYMKDGKPAHGRPEHLSEILGTNAIPEVLTWIAAQYAWADKNKKALEALGKKVYGEYLKEKEAAEAAKGKKPTAASKSGPVTVTMIGGAKPATKKAKAVPEDEDDGIVIEDSFTQGKKRVHTLKI